MSIYCLFSIENNYDQPPNNLVAWWSKKPSIEEVAVAMGASWPSTNDDFTLSMVRIWQGTNTRWGDTGYWVQELTKEGKVPES
jgi:hypothetical protein